MRSLRVLFLATRDWYNPATTGGDNTLWENARYLASVGHYVTFVCSTFPGAPDEASVDGIHVVRVGQLHWLWLSSFRYYRAHRREGFDVVVTEGFGGSRIPRLAPLYVKEPIISAWHQIHRDLFAAQYPRLLVGPLNLMERFAAWVHRNTYVQAYTEEWKDSFPRLGFRPDRIFVVPVSIRDEWLSKSNGHDINRPQEIVWIGKLRRYKCAHHLVSAMPAVAKAIPNVKLIIIGRQDDLRYESDLRRLVRDLNLSKNVEFRLNLSESDKRDLLMRAQALVVTSAVEGFGIVVLEANACGVPVVASSGVPPSVVIDGTNGLRYEFGDIHGLADQLIRVMCDGDLHKRLAAGAASQADQFKWSLVGPKFQRSLELAVQAPSR